MVKKYFKITNEAGIHARPATTLVNEAMKYECEILLAALKKSVDFKSIMGVMSLGVYKGEIIKVVCDGADEEEAMSHITFLILDLKLGRDY